MKLIFRCSLATVAVFVCFSLVRDNPGVYAQSCCTGYCPSPVPACPHPSCDQTSGTCQFYWVCDSPIIVDVQDKGFHLTSQANGVLFKFSGDQKKQVAWTDPQFGNAWLALDRNENGTIDDATELFGNFTPQPSSASPNGFLALAVYDSPQNGGDGDGYITPADSIYSHLLLWTDSNHNGLSESSELQTLAQANVTSISLNYREGHRQDQFGNLFRYNGRITLASKDFDKHIYDVYLVGVN